MKNTEIIELSDKELQEHLENERDYLTKLKLNHAISPLDNPHKIVESRRNVAKLLTELNRRKRENAGKEVSQTVQQDTIKEQ
jgi:large subunit ribosomal protein L29